MKKLVLLFAFISALTAYGQNINFYPKVVYVDPNKRTGEIIVSNTSFKTVEVEMKNRWGFPSFDSLGNLIMQYKDSSLVSYSLDPYIKIFPKKFILKGQKQQVVRFIITHPGNIPDGTYWTRIIASAQVAGKTIDSTNLTKKDTLNMRYAIITNVQTAVFYEKGAIESKISINKYAHAIDDSNRLFLVLDVNKYGNTPFWGNCFVEIYNKSNNELVESINAPLPVYLNMERKILLKKKDKYIKGNNYLAKFTINNKREEVPKQMLPKFDEIQNTYEFSIP